MLDRNEAFWFLGESKTLLHADRDHQNPATPIPTVMKQDSVEIDLTSKENRSRYDYTLSTTVTAFLEGDRLIEEKTLIFDTDPIGNNYRRTYLEATFADWSTIAEIRDFLAHHFADMEGKTRSMTVPVEDGSFSLVPFDGEGRESEDFDEIRIRAAENRVEFGGLATMEPHIHTYEVMEDGEPQDQNNAEKLLDLLDEVLGQNQVIPSASRDGGVNDHLTSLDDADQMSQNYEKALREFKDEEYDDAARDIGRASKALIKQLCTEIYDEDDQPDSMGARLNKLNSTEDGVPSFIGKAIAPAWWIRNQAEHNSDYTTTRADARYALVCFQVALKKYVED